MDEITLFGSPQVSAAGGFPVGGRIFLAAKRRVAWAAKRRWGATRGLLVLSLGVCLPLHAAQAAGFLIVDGEIAGPQVLAGDGDVGVVEAGGTIDATGAGASGIYSLAANAVARNAGTIVLGVGGYGIGLLGTGGEGINSGRIEATGTGITAIYGWAPILINSGSIAASGGATGIRGLAGGGLVRNAGSIELGGSGNVGIDSFGVGATVENLGRIIITGSGQGVVGYAADQQLINAGLVEISNGGYGIYALTGNIAIVNRGTLTVSGSTGYGIYAAGDNQTVDNSGVITTNGMNGHGIMVLGEGSSVSNSGRISAAGQLASGVMLRDRNSILSNAGYIYSEQDYAIHAWEGDNTVNLLAGSVIDGEVRMEGLGNTVTFGPGLNARVTFSGTLPQTISSSNPMVTSGNTVTVLDRAGFVLSEDMALALAASAGQGRDAGLSACVEAGDAGCHVTAWLNGVGGLGGRAEQEDLASLAFAHGGLEAGLDIDLGPVSAGAFAAAAAAQGEVGSSQATDISASIFGGQIGLRQGMMFAQASASLGLLDLSGSRQVADNMVAGGLLTAESDSTGRFVSPALVAGLDLAMGEMTLTPSLAGRYTQLTLSGYAEDGASDDLSVSERMVEELAVRAQLALALTPMLTEAGGFAWTLRAGADARRRSGEDIVAALAGSPVRFASGAHGDSLGGFVGANLNYRLGTATLSSEVELGLDTAGLHNLSARATLAGGF
jgi:hypothetical protein